VGFKSSLTQLLTTIAAVLLVGCSKGWILDYHEPAEQFLAKDVATKAKPYVGRHLKITIKGIVSKVDVSNTNSSMIYLKDGIECNLGKFSRMASSCKVGEVVYIDGFLKHCDDDKVLLEPAILRDPTAKFIPTKAEVESSASKTIDDHLHLKKEKRFSSKYAGTDLPGGRH
tara:strand:+ start:106 stop:618 length:513 start_codon:yes stop_codon:yes gene_type:complete